MQERNKKKRENGKKGARARWQDHSDANGKDIATPAIDTPEQTDRFHIPSSSIHDQLATLADSARKATVVTEITRSPAFEFCRWMLDEGIHRGVIGAHFGLDPLAWCNGQVEAAETLVAAYGEDACRSRATRLFDAAAAKRIRRIVSVVTLGQVWDYAELRGEAGGHRRAVGISDERLEGL